MSSLGFKVENILKPTKFVDEKSMFLLAMAKNFLNSSKKIKDAQGKFLNPKL